MCVCVCVCLGLGQMFPRFSGVCRGWLFRDNKTYFITNWRRSERLPYPDIRISMSFLKIASSMRSYAWTLTFALPLMRVSISSKTILPPPPPTLHDLIEGSKNPLPTTMIVYKTLLSVQNRESKAPPPRHIVRKFHKYIYKLWHYLKWKTLWFQQIGRFFNEETDY